MFDIRESNERLSLFRAQLLRVVNAVFYKPVGGQFYDMYDFPFSALSGNRIDWWIHSDDEGDAADVQGHS